MTVKIAIIYCVKFVILFLIILPSQVNAQSKDLEITVVVSEISNEVGQIIVHLYDSEESFLETPIKTEIVKIKDGNAVAVISEVPKGVYAIGVIHDENSNNEIDFNFIGMPTEDVASSNNAKGFFGTPSFDDAKFEVSTDSLVLKIKM